MQQHEFKAISDSTGEEYSITAALHDGLFSMQCTCQAGVVGQMCKHRLAIIDGESNDDAALEVRQWLQSSKAHEVMGDIKALEAQAANLKKQISARKAQLGRLIKEGC